MRFFALLVVLLVAACSSGGQIHLQAVETAEYYSVIAPIQEWEGDCRLTFADEGGILVLKVDDWVNSCPLDSLAPIEYALLHREEGASEPTVFRRGVMRVSDTRQLTRFHNSFNAVAVWKIGEDMPSSVVVMIDRYGIAPFGYDVWESHCSSC